jgi:soluble lytic murein transglycosylase-like protein
MTRKVFIISILQVLFIVLPLCFTLLDVQHRNDTLAVKNKLLRREIAARQWEITQARSRNRELDAARWMLRQTELWHGEWSEIIETVYITAGKYQLRPELVMSIIHRESNFDRVAQSYFATSEQPVAQGLMQINTSVWKDELKIDENRIMEPKYNIDLGCRILKIYMDETGDEVRALELYNCGYRLTNPRYVPRIKSSIFYGRE